MFNKQVDMSFRWSMSWFIFSEVMFFAAFFGALYYARVSRSPGWATPTTSCCGPTQRAVALGRPGPRREQFSAMGAWGIPALNTFLLLSSGVTVTYAHWALKEDNRGR